MIWRVLLWLFKVNQPFAVSMDCPSFCQVNIGFDRVAWATIPQRQRALKLQGGVGLLTGGSKVHAPRMPVLPLLWRCVRKLELGRFTLWKQFTTI
jgi:hypothetical protein